MNHQYEDYEQTMGSNTIDQALGILEDQGRTQS